MDAMTLTEILKDATSVIGQGITATQTIVAGVPFFLLPMYFVFGRKLIGYAKTLTFQSRGRRRG